jgi:hypoxanthine phosphoribosyltransferase
MAAARTDKIKPAAQRPAPAATMARLRPAPARLRSELAGVLITKPQLARRVRELAAELQTDYQGKDLIAVALLNGTVMFLADLIRHLELPLRLDFLGVSSYGNRTTSGPLKFTKELRLDVRNRDVLVVDDILDTGQTLTRVLENLRAARPRSLRTCVLLDKPSRRTHPLRADYTGFVIPDFFVVGYGLDFAERYRNLPFVGVLKT